MKLILGSISLLLIGLGAAALLGLDLGLTSASTTVTQTTIGSGVSCSSSCVNGVCENTCSDGGNVKVGNGDVIEKEVDIKGFNEVSVNSLEVDAIQSDQYSLVLIADSNLIEDIVVESKNGALNIERKNGAYQSETMMVKLGTPKMNSFSNFGAEQSNISGFDQSKLKLHNDGAGTIKLEDSKIAKLVYEGHGSTTLNAKGAELDSVKLNVSGASEVYLGFSEKAGDLTGSVEGVSSVYYCGKPRVNIERFGIVDIERQCD